MFKISLALSLLLGAQYLTAQNAHLDSLKHRLEVATQAEEAEALVALAEAYTHLEPLKAVEFARRAIESAQRTGDHVAEANALRSLGFAQMTTGDLPQGIVNLEYALELAREFGTKSDIAQAHSALGVAYNLIGQYTKSLAEHLESLRMKEELGQATEIPASLNNLGIVHMNINRYAEAEDFFKRAYTMRIANGDSLGAVRSLSNIGLVKFKQHQLDDAISTLNEAVTLAERTQYKGGMAYAVIIIGQIRLEQGRYQEALKSLKLAHDSYTELGQAYGRIQALNNMGLAYERLGNRREGLKHLNNAAALGTIIGAISPLSETHQNLSELYEQRGDWRLALSHYKKYIELRDSLLARGEANRVADIRIEYERAARQREVELLKQESVIKQYQVNFLLAGVALLIVLIGALVVRHRTARKHQRQLAEKTKTLESLNAELEEKIAQIKVMSGLIPICAHCKKIRNDKGYWEHVEAYISEHADVSFSHGICPECAERHFPGVAMKIRKERR